MSNGNENVESDPKVEKFERLDAAKRAIEDSLVWAEKGLHRNPSPEQRRAIDESILEMQERLTILEERILAILGGTGGAIPMPTPEHIAATGALTAEVEGLTNKNLTAAAAVSVATKGLKLVKELSA